jgi:hypothetical protein
MGKSIEELLKLIEEKPSKKRKEREESRNVLEFIQELNVESGTEAIPNFLIFYIYRCLWKPEDQKRKVKKITFFQTFGKKFPLYRKNKQRYYMLKEGLFKVNDELIKAAKQYDKQHWQSKKPQKKVSVP